MQLLRDIVNLRLALDSTRNHTKFCWLTNRGTLLTIVTAVICAMDAGVAQRVRQFEDLILNTAMSLNKTIDRLMHNQPNHLPSPPVLCAYCAKPVGRSSSQYRPFCSERCQQLDLSNWLDERYGLPYEGEDSQVPEPEEEA